MKRLGLLLALISGFAAAGAPQPFVWSEELRPGAIEVKVKVAPDCYLYVDQTRLQLSSGDRILEGWQAPPSSEIQDQFTGKQSMVYSAGEHVWKLPLPADSRELKLEVRYQGCRSKTAQSAGVCFLPKSFTRTVSGAAAPTVAAPTTPEPAPAAVAPAYRKIEGTMSADQFLSFLCNTPDNPAAAAASPWASRGILAILLLALLGGIGLNLTPCILPMIPVNLAILGAEGSSWRTGVLRGSIYGAGMAAAYGLLGVAAVLTGARFGALNASPAFNFIIGGIFFALSFAMFGAFNLDFSSLSAKVDPTRLNWGKNLTAFALGVVAALLAGACVAPVLIAVLVLAAELYGAGHASGILLPFVLGIGMALPWPLAGGGLAILPKPGAWMNHIKVAFGIIIIIAGGYYTYLGITLSTNSGNPDREIAKLEQAIQTAKANRQPLLIDFWASWCKNCLEMDRNVLSNPAVQNEIKTNFTFTKFQAEKLNHPAIKQILDRYQINGLPAFVIINP